MLKLYRIFQTENNHVDTYDEAVVVAESMEAAQKVHPSGNQEDWKGYNWGTWCIKPESVHVEYLADVPASSDLQAGDVVVSSFYGV
ncbi:hypothetical protein P13BB106kb_p045 [Pectobacterium phage DU_PP_V]|uniref:Uncharacterized protein n=1 Tax=Pectobacterium phage DU_PP_V TaxID=2041492 RepID=A0A2D2W6V6_9CAUD|nr:hypothetical protein HOS40_gp124 [Pectobacterium phage DU_PP_V]ATS94029.1 hypothetical protein P13BB106kb_p045 [Pectobacterium phage DU_PP_V]